MAHPETAPSCWRAAKRSGTADSDGLETSLGHAAGHPGHERRDAMQPSSISPRFTLPAQDTAAYMRQRYAEPRAWQWYYYDPTRVQHHPALLSSSPAMLSPPSPHISAPSDSASPATADTMLESFSGMLKALQTQFTAFQEGLGGVKSDVKDALAQLHAMRTAQDKTDKSIAELEDVIGIRTTSTRSKGRGTRGRGQSRSGKAGFTTEAPLKVDNTNVGTVSEKSLLQSVASIHSAIEVLLARDRASRSLLSLIHQETALPSSVNLVEQALPSAMGSSRPHPTLQSTQLSSTSQSESSSPIVLPTSEFGASASSPLEAPEKECADASIQACPPSSTSEPSSPSEPSSLSNSHGNTPGLVPVDWSGDSGTPWRFASNPMQPPTFTAGCLAHFLSNAQDSIARSTLSESRTLIPDYDRILRSTTDSNSQLPTRTSSVDALCSHQNELASGIQQTDPTTLPTDSSSSNTLTVPSIGGTSPPTETPLSPARLSVQGSERLQTCSFTTKGVGPSTTPPQTVPPGDSHTSPSSSLSGARGMPIPVSWEHVGYPWRPHAELDLDDVGLTPDTEENEIPVTSRVETASSSVSTASEHRRQTPPVDVDDAGLPSGLPTPPSETVSEARERRAVARSTCEHSANADPRLILCTRLSGSFPAIFTPPCLTQEPSVGDETTLACTRLGSARQGSLAVFSDLPLPLTPALLSSSPAIRSSFTEESTGDVSGQVGEDKVVKEHTDFLSDAGELASCGRDATEGVSTNAQLGNATATSRADQAGIEASIGVTNSEMSVLVQSNELRPNALSDQGSSRVPLVVGDIDLSEAHESSMDQPDAMLPEHDPGVDVSGVDPAYLPTNEYRGEYDIHFSSPRRHPSRPASSTPSRYATPSGASDSRPMQDEDEVWHALILGGSGVSTPLSGSTPLSMMFSQQPSRASSEHLRSHSPQSLSIDPSMLHDPPSQVLHKSLSPLTSLEGMNADKDGHDNTDAGAARHSDVPPAHAPPDTSHLQSQSRRNSGVRRRRSEPQRAPSRSAHCTLVGAGSEAMTEDGRLGGPTASVDELAMLARRAPLKIWLRLPGGMRGVKRKWDVDGVDSDDVAGGGADAECGHVGEDSVMPIDEATQEGHRDTAFTGVMQPPLIGAGTSTPKKAASSGVVDSTRKHSDMTIKLPASSKSAQKDGERRHKKLKRESKAKQKSTVTYHVRNGQIVTVASELESRSQAPTTSSASQPGQVNQDVQSPLRIRLQKRQAHLTTKSPLSSPANPSQPGSRRARLIESSPTKEDAWNTISRCAGTWPELPSGFSHWDAQFILCDNCDKWYHYGCVGIESGDPRLETSALFICPTCHIQSARRQTTRNQSDTCARPDCPEPQVTAESELYFVEKLVGRKKVEGYIYMWLAKWEGYPMTQATWIPKENVVGDGTRLFNAFLEDAIEEGANLSRDVILLQEARDAGWDSETC